MYYLVVYGWIGFCHESVYFCVVCVCVLCVCVLFCMKVLCVCVLRTCVLCCDFASLRCDFAFALCLVTLCCFVNEVLPFSRGHCILVVSPCNDVYNFYQMLS